MDWKELLTINQIGYLIEQSFSRPVVVYKHSTRCSISHMAKSRLEREFNATGIDFYYLDLIAHREVSNAISEKFSVHHESPQILLLKNGECIYDESHNAISMPDIIEQAQIALQG